MTEHPPHEHCQTHADLEAFIEASIQAGRLPEARVATEELLAHGDDGGAYVLLAVLRCQLGDFEGAVATLEALASKESWRALASELGLCVEADQIRAERRDDDGVAQKRAGIAPPPEWATWQLGAAVRHARSDFDGAREMLDKARAGAPALRGHVVRADGRTIAFDNIRDSDDLTGAMLEAIGPRGLLDIPYEDLRSIEIKPMRTYHDTLWPVARLVTAGGDSVTARVPALYPRSGEHAWPEIRSGALTLWDRPHGYAVATGQREVLYQTADGSISLGWYQTARIVLEHG